MAESFSWCPSASLVLLRLAHTFLLLQKQRKMFFKAEKNCQLHTCLPEVSLFGKHFCLLDSKSSHFCLLVCFCQGYSQRGRPLVKWRVKAARNESVIINQAHRCSHPVAALSFSQLVHRLSRVLEYEGCHLPWRHCHHAALKMLHSFMLIQQTFKRSN